MTGGPPPLDGVRVVDLSQNLAGPFCTRILADMGADVVKVERPGGGDSSRHWGPPFCDGESPIFLASNAGKRSVVVDLKEARGREVVLRLAEGADVFVESFRPGVAEELGVGPDAVRARAPAILYLSVATYGESGPLQDLPGFDPLMQAHSGLMSVTGEAGGGPVRVGTSVVDMGTGMWGALAVLGGLRSRERTGEGLTVGTALYDTALAWMGYHILGYVGAGHVPGRLGSGLGMIAPYQAFPAADGHVMVAAGTDALFRRLCDALALDALPDDERFRENADRVRNRDELASLVGEATRTRSADDLLALLRDAGVPAAPILEVDEVWSEPQTGASGMFDVPGGGAEDGDRGDGTRSPGARPGVRLPFRWDGLRPRSPRPPPTPGAHTREVLEEAGYDASEIDELLARRIVSGDAPRR